MSHAPLVEAEKTHLAVMQSRHAGRISVNGRTLTAAVLAKRGTRLDMDGGLIQEKLITFLVACSALAEAEIIDATTDATRAVRLTDLQTGRVYQLGSETSPPERSPQGVYWKLTGRQITKNA